MERYGKCFCVILLATALWFVGCRESPSGPKDPGRDEVATELSELASLLQEALPAGWRVSINGFHDDEEISAGEMNLEIHPLKQVSFPHAPLENAPISWENDEDMDEEPYPFYLNLHKSKYLTPDEYKIIRDRNDAIEKRCREFTASLRDVPRHGKVRAYGQTNPLWYFPENEAQRKRVAEFEDFYEKNKKTFLPQDLYYNKMAFIFYDPRHGLLIDDEAFNAECDAVVGAIKAVMKEY
jgi:hypothetical protein